MFKVGKSPSGQHWQVVFKSTVLDTYLTKQQASEAMKRFALTYAKMGK